jgi:glycosyltransferase involved in cell wall biosynthesis
VKILWASPLPPVRSGVSDYAVELLPELGARASVRVVAPPAWRPPENWKLTDTVEIVPHDTVAEADEIPLVHLGNNPHHLWLVDRLDDPRAVAVLHDLVLHHLLVEVAASSNDSDALGRGLSEVYGAAGDAVAIARSLGLTHARDPFLMPAWWSFVNKARAVVVHSSWAENAVRRQRPHLPVARVGLAVADPGAVDRTRERALLGLEADEVVLMHLGFLTPEKGLRDVLTGLAAAIRTGVPARLVLVGEGIGMDAIIAAGEAVGIADRLTATGYLARERFPTAPAAADLGVVLRTPSAGETSAAAVRFLACGTPVAVGGVHQFLEWPEAAAPRVTPGPPAPAELARLLAEAASGGGGWSHRRSAARTAYEAVHRPADVAEQMIDALEKMSSEQ